MKKSRMTPAMATATRTVTWKLWVRPKCDAIANLKNIANQQIGYEKCAAKRLTGRESDTGIPCMLYFPWVERVNSPSASMACLTLAFLWTPSGTDSLYLRVRCMGYATAMETSAMIFPPIAGIGR